MCVPLVADLNQQTYVDDEGDDLAMEVRRGRMSGLPIVNS
jgi:hypothetical protein